MLVCVCVCARASVCVRVRFRLQLLQLRVQHGLLQAVLLRDRLQPRRQRLFGRVLKVVPEGTKPCAGARTHVRSRSRTHARTHARTHTHAQTQTHTHAHTRAALRLDPPRVRPHCRAGGTPSHCSTGQAHHEPAAGCAAQPRLRRAHLISRSASPLASPVPCCGAAAWRDGRAAPQMRMLHVRREAKLTLPQCGHAQLPLRTHSTQPIREAAQRSCTRATLRRQVKCSMGYKIRIFGNTGYLQRAIQRNICAIS